MRTLFEPRFYERAAQRHLAVLLDQEVFINVPWGLSGPPDSRPEIDAVLTEDGRWLPAEIKAHAVHTDTADDVVAKYRALGFSQLVLVAPEFTRPALRLLASARLRVRAVVFMPDLESIAAYYSADWHTYIPAWVHATLATGQHHIRFMLTRPTNSGRIVVGQPRTRIYSADTMTRIIHTLPSPPARVLWTPQRFTIPRDVIARRSKLTALGGYVPIDIDGDRIHRALYACQLSPVERTCRHCVQHAQRELSRLRRALPEAPWVDFVSSGGRGVHAYLRDEPGLRSRLLRIARSSGVRLDEPVTASIKATIALPGSLHAGTTRPVTSLVSGWQENPDQVIAC
jgi:hypothetical protein